MRFSPPPIVLCRSQLPPAVYQPRLGLALPANVDTRVAELRRALRTLDTKIQHLTSAIEQGGADLPSIIALLSKRQEERDALVGEIGSAETLHQIHVDRAAIEAEVQSKIANWRELVAGSVSDGRQLLREVLEAPLRFTPDGKTYRFTAPVATGKLIAGAVLPTNMASPRGPDRFYTLRSATPRLAA